MILLKAIAWQHLCDEPEVTSRHLRLLMGTQPQRAGRARRS